MYSFFELSLITVLFKSISKTKFLRTELLILVFVCVCVCERERERERERGCVCACAYQPEAQGGPRPVFPDQKEVPQAGLP